MPMTIGMIGTPGIGVVAGRKSFGTWMRSYWCNQIHPQHVLQSLRQWYVDVGKLSFGLALPLLIFWLMLTKSLSGL